MLEYQEEDLVVQKQKLPNVLRKEFQDGYHRPEERRGWHEVLPFVITTLLGVQFELEPFHFQAYSNSGGRWQVMLGCGCETNHATRYDEVDAAECQAEAEMIFKAEQELVELRWSMQKARSTAEQQVEALMREVEALKKSEPELAQEITQAVEEAQTLQAAEKAEASAAEKAAQEKEAGDKAVEDICAWERHAEVAAFLKKHGFRSINEAKRSFLSSSYALHRADGGTSSLGWSSERAEGVGASEQRQDSYAAGKEWKICQPCGASRAERCGKSLQGCLRG
eukprot:s89_g34.t1